MEEGVTDPPPIFFLNTIFWVGRGGQIQFLSNQLKCNKRPVGGETVSM